MISKKFLIALKMSSDPAYRVAQKAKIDPSTLSKLVCGIQPVNAGDQRIIAVGKVLGVPPEDCFDDSTNS